MSKALLMFFAIFAIFMIYGAVEFMKKKGITALDVITGLFVIVCLYVLTIALKWIYKEND